MIRQPAIVHMTGKMPNNVNKFTLSPRSKRGITIGNVEQLYRTVLTDQLARAVARSVIKAQRPHIQLSQRENLESMSPSFNYFSYAGGPQG